MLKALNPKAELYWSEPDKHAITKINDVYYDIGGEINEEYIRIREYMFVAKGKHEAYHLLKHSEIEDISGSAVVEKYFK
jgi:hypothetical protein